MTFYWVHLFKINQNSLTFSCWRRKFYEFSKKDTSGPNIPTLIRLKCKIPWHLFFLQNFIFPWHITEFPGNEKKILDISPMCMNPVLCEISIKLRIQIKFHLISHEKNKRPTGYGSLRTEWNSHCRYVDVMQHFSNPVIPINERIIICAGLGFEEEECFFFIIIILPYMGTTVNGVWPFGQLLNPISTVVLTWNLMEIGLNFPSM